MLPIAIFAFNRPDLLRRTLTALLANELADTAALTIFCDGPRHEQDEPATRAVRTLAQSVQGVADVEVVERPRNMGCAASIIDGLTEMFRLHERLIVEDSCDALGSSYTLDDSTRLCGTFGDIATFSFYPAHHITMGEGGAVACDDPLLRKILLSLRDWGRDCWCAPGRDDSCKRRFQWKFPLLPEGYDHKYVYSHLGYNLKITDMQAAVGLEQLKRLDDFTAARRRNFALLSEELATLDGGPLQLPRPTPGSDPSWFGYLLTLDPHYNREDLLQYLNAHKIGTRLLFAGNMTRQPCFEQVSYRTAAPLEGTDTIMRRTFWIGLFPGLTEDHVRYAARTLQNYF